MRRLLFLTLFVACFLQQLSAQYSHSLWVGESYTCDASSAMMGSVSDITWTSNGLSLSGALRTQEATITNYFFGTGSVTVTWNQRLTIYSQPEHCSKTWYFTCRDNQVSISPSNITLFVGESDYVSFSHQYDHNAHAANAYFSSSNSAIATVSKSTGEITAISPGTTYINVHSKISSVSSSCKITVREIDVESVSIPNSVSCFADETKQLSMIVNPSNSTIRSIQWYSENTSIATINSSGELKAVNPGTTNIYCIINERIRSNNCSVSIAEPEFKLTNSIPKDNSFGLSVFIEPSIEFTSDIFAGDNHSLIKLKEIDTNEEIDGTLSILGKSIKFTPSKALKAQENYCWILPPNALKNRWNKHYPMEIQIRFRTGELEKLILSTNIKEDFVEKGTKIKLITNNNPNAQIYYTTDGSIPNENNYPYNGDISINENITIKAIAIADGYIPSDILTVAYKVIQLESTNYPINDSENVSIHTIPQVKFNADIFESANIEDICLRKGQELIEGEIIVSDSTIFFVPSNLLEIGMSYTLHIPQNSVHASTYEGNKEITLFFSTGRYPIDVAAGYDMAAVLMSDGSLWAWGKDAYLGNGSSEGSLYPIKIMDDIKKVNLGFGCGFALKNDNTLWGWGRNNEGQLGDGTFETRLLPVKIMDNVKEINTNDNHTAIIKNDNTLWMCGFNNYGQIGDGTLISRSTPVRIMSNVKGASVGSRHTAAITSDGSLYTWGSNWYGELGGWYDYGSTDDGVKTPFKITTITNADMVACGENHTVAIDDEGALRTTGDNSDGQLGTDGGVNWNRFLRPISNGVSFISAMNNNTAYINDYGDLYVCGKNEYGVVKDGGFYQGFGEFTRRLTDVKSVDIGHDMVIALTNNGDVYAWGNNESGQIGTGSKYPTKISKPTRIMNGFSYTKLEHLVLQHFTQNGYIGEDLVIALDIYPYNVWCNIKWESSNKSIATVSQRGVVTGISEGEVIITAIVELNDIDEPDIFELSFNITIKAIPHYNLIYKVDGTEYKRESVMYGKKINAAEVPFKEGYTFRGWNGMPTIMPAQDVIVEGKFTVNSYRLTYMLDGEEYSADNIDYGTVMTQKEILTKEGHTFSGWSEIPATMPAQDVTVEGSFTVNSYRLVYLLDGAEYSVDSIAYGTELVQKEALTKEGHTFSGWSELPATMPAQNVTVEGTFTINRYTLLYMVDGAEYKTVELEYGASIITEAVPAKEGHTFSGWSEIPVTMPARDVTIEGKFTVNSYRLVYLLDGAEYFVDSVAYGTELVLKEALTKEGHTFSGWSEIPETMPAKDVTVEGTFTINRYTLLYMVDGAEYKKVELEYGANIIAEAIPAKEGHTFSGWSEIPATMPAQDVTVTGSFTVNSYTITYRVDGEVYATEEVAYGEVIVLKEAPEKDGYIFSGWSEVPETMPAEDLEVTGSFASSIKAVITKTHVDVYSLQGMLLKRQILVDELKNELPQGFYIVDGKKVLVK